MKPDFPIPIAKIQIIFQSTKNLQKNAEKGENLVGWARKGAEKSKKNIAFVDWGANKE